MIVTILIADNIVVRFIETDMMALILISMNLFIYFLFMPWIRKEATNENKDEEKPQP